MVTKGCTFELEAGPCFATPSIAIWANKHSKRKTWTCDKHDRQLSANLRRVDARSQYRRQAIK